MSGIQTHFYSQWKTWASHNNHSFNGKKPYVFSYSIIWVHSIPLVILSLCDAHLSAGKGKAWENAIEICKELAYQHSEVTFN
jgi:hypothetical protein